MKNYFVTHVPQGAPAHIGTLSGISGEDEEDARNRYLATGIRGGTANEVDVWVIGPVTIFGPNGLVEE